MDSERPFSSGLEYKTALVFTAHNDTLGQLQFRRLWSQFSPMVRIVRHFLEGAKKFLAGSEPCCTVLSVANSLGLDAVEVVHGLIHFGAGYLDAKHSICCHIYHPLLGWCGTICRESKATEENSNQPEITNPGNGQKNPLSGFALNDYQFN